MTKANIIMIFKMTAQTKVLNMSYEYIAKRLTYLFHADLLNIKRIYCCADLLTYLLHVNRLYCSVDFFK